MCDRRPEWYDGGAATEAISSVKAPPAGQTFNSS